MILTIRTDNPQAEMGIYSGSGEQLAYRSWKAHRELSDTIHVILKELLDSLQTDWTSITAIIFYEGPGSFTGLRIGAAVANALATSLNVGVVNQYGDDWVEKGLGAVEASQKELAIPKYGSDPHITAQKK